MRGISEFASLRLQYEFVEAILQPDGTIGRCFKYLTNYFAGIRFGSSDFLYLSSSQPNVSDGLRVMFVIR